MKDSNPTKHIKCNCRWWRIEKQDIEKVVIYTNEYISYILETISDIEGIKTVSYEESKDKIQCEFVVDNGDSYHFDMDLEDFTFTKIACLTCNTCLGLWVTHNRIYIYKGQLHTAPYTKSIKEYIEYRVDGCKYRLLADDRLLKAEAICGL